MAVATRQTFTPPKQYSFRQLEELWLRAGGRATAAPTAAAIALAESGGNPNAEGHNTNGTTDRGLWQINSVHGGLSTTNVAANVQAAVKIYNESGWSPWTTYKTGAYLKTVTPSQLTSGVSLEKNVEGKGVFSQSIEAAFGALETFGFGAATNVGAKAVGQPAPSSTLGNQVASGEGAAEAILTKGLTGWVKELIQGFSKLALSGVLLLAGAVLVVYGIMVAVRPRESALSIPMPAIV